MFDNFLNYLKSLTDSGDQSASMRLVAYGGTIVFGFFWLTWDMIRGPITAEWNVAFGLLLGAVTTAKVMKS